MNSVWKHIWYYIHEYYLHIENNFETGLATNLYAKDAWILEYAVDKYYLLLEHREGWAEEGRFLLIYLVYVQKISAL